MPAHRVELSRLDEEIARVERDGEEVVSVVLDTVDDGGVWVVTRRVRTDIETR